MLRARKIDIVRGRVARHRHCAKALRLSIAFMTFSLFRDVLKQAGKAVLDKLETVPGNSGGRSYGKSVKKRRNTILTHFPTVHPGLNFFVCVMTGLFGKKNGFLGRFWVFWGVFQVCVRVCVESRPAGACVLRIYAGDTLNFSRFLMATSPIMIFATFPKKFKFSPGDFYCRHPKKNR